jgi:hypothetical protein
MVTAYDGDLQMFREPSRELDVGMLRFLRWLAERGELEHDVSNAAGGERSEMVEPAHA